MADKAISELEPVSTITLSDNFVLEQANEARRLTGQVLLNELAAKLDGHGGINNITGPVSVGDEDTYTIHYADQTTSTFTVTNGRGIASIAKKSTSGLIDTYQINYTDGSTPSTFTVTNGAKGDKGDNLTVQSVTMTYGVSDNQSTQPTTWKSSISQLGNVQGKYVWTKFVTTYNVGDPYTHYEIAYQGRDLSVSSTTMTYGKSSSTSTQPTTWYNTIAELGDVAGLFVWTKFVTTYSDNTTFTHYEIAYQGRNGTGTGTVTAVNTIGPDASGNVTLTAANVNYTPSGSSTAVTVSSVLDNKIITLSSPINIPAPGVSATYTVNGITASHRVILWNFSESAENNPPTDIRIATSASSISVTNLGIETIYETIQPMFAVPIAKSAS